MMTSCVIRHDEDDVQINQTSNGKSLGLVIDEKTYGGRTTYLVIFQKQPLRIGGFVDVNRTLPGYMDVDSPPHYQKLSTCSLKLSHTVGYLSNRKRFPWLHSLI